MILDSIDMVTKKSVQIIFIYKVKIESDMIDSFVALLQEYYITISAPKQPDILVQDTRARIVSLARQAYIKNTLSKLLKTITQEESSNYYIKVTNEINNTYNFEVGVDAEVGSNILDVAHENNIPLEGSCEGSMVCSTCHVTVAEGNKLEEPSGEEEDTLDTLGFRLSMSSRLGCQVKITHEMDGIQIVIPSPCCVR